MALEELRNRNWVASKAKLSHKPGSDKMYNSTLPLSKRFYYQYLLSLPSVFETGLASLPSDQPQGFYKFILAGKNPHAGLGANTYKQLLGGGGTSAGMQVEGEGLALQDQSSDDAIVRSRGLEGDPSRSLASCSAGWAFARSLASARGAIYTEARPAP